LLPRHGIQLPARADDACVTAVLEQAGGRIAERERQSGPIEKLHGYASVTVRSVAMSRMRLSATRMAKATLGSEQSQVALSVVPSAEGSPQQIESDVLFREVLAQLTPDEQLVCVWKKAGFSTKEIASYRGSSVTAIDTL